MSRNRPLIVFAAVLGFLLAAAPASPQAAGGGPEAAPNELLVGFEPGVSARDRAQARRSNDARLIEVVVAEDMDRRVVERVSIPNGADRDRYERRFESDPNVAYAEPNWKLDIIETSNDPYYTNGSLWGMYGDDATTPRNVYGSQADEAWASGNVGSGDVWVGVIDQGIQYYHPDLNANVGPNPGDPTFDGVDNDGNGYVDDVYGWDFYHGDNTVYDSKKHDEHGTHVAGTIGAEGGNGAGVVGVNWNVKMLSGKFLGPMGGYTSDAVKAVNYFSQFRERYNAGDPRGLNVVATNNSWGGGGYAQSLYDAIERAREAGVLFVAAAGNSGDDTDVSPSYPASYTNTNIISVAALRSDGSLASWSNYGATTVDLAAPGAGVYSTVPDGYASFSGTSMAAPHVAGAAALYKSAHPTATMAGIRQAIFDTTLFTPSVSGKVLTNGRLDVSSFFATVNGNPPKATTTSASTDEDTAVIVTLGGTDAETCELKFAITGHPANGQLGSFSSSTGNCTGSSGSYSDSATVSYTPALNFNGTDSFSYSVEDGHGNVVSSTVTVTVTALNDAPVAYGDAVDAVVGVQVSFNVLTNDVDVDGDDLDIASHETVTGLSCDLETDACAYTGAATGQVSFGYTATDGTLTSSATVTITVADQAVTLHIGDLDGVPSPAPGPNKDVTVTATVHDAVEALVHGATVSGTWSDGTTGTCTTDGSGTCSVAGRFNSKNYASITFTVTGVTASGYTYDQPANHDADGDSTGTEITVTL